MPIAFLKEFISSPLETGAVMPSSKRLAGRLLDYWPKDQKGVVVEYGPGTGAISKIAFNRLTEERFFAIELNTRFVEKLRAGFPYMDVEEGSASDICKFLKKRELESADLIVSGIPWALMPEEIQMAIMKETYEALSEGGTFSTFTYVTAKWFMPQARSFYKVITSVFDKVETSKIVWGNMPPAMVYHCHKK